MASNLAARILAEAATGVSRRRDRQIEILCGRYSGAPTGSRMVEKRKLNALRLFVNEGGSQIAKRAMDIFISSIMLLLLTPLFLAIAIAIKLTDRGPVLFWQTRVGKHGAEFQFPKFRSMVVNSEQLRQQLMAQNDHGASVTFKMKDDPRITKVGRIIRKLSLDELPQLWCVLKGEMSLVGPRPALPKEVALYKVEERRRLDAMPGLTCIWQVSGRGDLPFPEQLALDVYYIENRSLMLDIKLLLWTIPAVILGKGAY